MQSNKHRAVEQRVETHAVHIKASPLPDPDVLGAYDKVASGAASKIVDLFEKQTIHRMSIEDRQLKIKEQQMRMVSRNSLCGIISANLFGALVVLASLYLVLNGFYVEATLFGGVGMSTIIGIFIYGTKAKQI